MPVITATLIEGYDAATRRRLSERLTDAVLASIAAPVEGGQILRQEVWNDLAEPAGAPGKS